MNEDFIRNDKKDVILVRHADLERTSKYSIFRSDCPVCRVGILNVWREQETLKLSREDSCAFCGQRFVYEDIEALRVKEKVMT